MTIAGDGGRGWGVRDEGYYSWNNPNLYKNANRGPNHYDLDNRHFCNGLGCFSYGTLHPSPLTHPGISGRVYGKRQTPGCRSLPNSLILYLFSLYLSLSLSPSRNCSLSVANRKDKGKNSKKLQVSFTKTWWSVTVRVKVVLRMPATTFSHPRSPVSLTQSQDILAITWPLT